MNDEETTHCRPVDDLAELLHPGPILLLQRAGRVSAKPLHEGEAIVIGRSPHVHVSVDDPRMSRRHLQVYLSGTDVFVEDLRSTNGTFLDEQQVSGRRPVAPGATITAGEAVIRIEGLEAWRARCSSLASHDRVEAALADAVALGGVVSLLAFRPPAGASLLEWGRRLAKALPGDATIGHYAGTTLEAVCPRRDATAVERLALPLLLHTKAVAGVASWPHPIRTPQAMVSAALGALEQATHERPLQRAVAEDASEVLARDPKSIELMATVERMADSHATVLVAGETGAGKEVIARAIHTMSPRTGPFVAVNCGAIAPTLLESHLFGHVKGAFTGADRARPGVFRDAHGGTLFLDEIGDLPAPAQVALLRVLETRMVTPVGSSKTHAVDVRVVAASHRDLRAMADAGDFRWDLLYRLEVLSIEVPPLRARPLDILPMARHFLDKARSLHGSQVVALSPAVERCLQAYHWPGNVRELRNVVERASVMARAAEVMPCDLPDRVRQASPTSALDRTPQPLHPGDDTFDPTEELTLPFPELTLAEHTERLEAALIRRALAACKHNQSEAARLLQLPRRTLVYKLGRLPMEEHVAEADLALAMIEERTDDTLPHRDRLATVLERLLVRLHREQPDLDQLADQLGITVRTLKGKLPS